MSYHDRANLDKQIEHLQGQIESLQAQKKHLEETDPRKRFAIWYHGKFCRHNHTDGCGWEYEVSKGIHDWKGSTHQHWLADSQKFYCEMVQMLDQHKGLY